MLGSGSPDPWKMAAHFVYESLLPMLLLAVGLGLADARTIGQPLRVAPYAAAAVFAAVFGQLLFNATSPLLGLRQCSCTMDDWPVGGHTANMLPDSLLICAFVTAGYVYRRRAALRVARLHAARLERAQLMRQTLESRLQAMQACIEPEFLFDTLAEVERMHATDPATAVRLLDELIVYLRAALPHLRESTSVVAKECELAYAYLNIQKMRRAGALSFAFEIGADAQDANMPPMVLLPLLDHALRDEFAVAGASAVAARGRPPLRRHAADRDVRRQRGVPARRGGQRRHRADPRSAAHALRRRPRAWNSAPTATGPAHSPWTFPMKAPTAILAEDEPVLRAELKEMLAAQWPELIIVAEAEDGLMAGEALARHAPDILFLDIEMPGRTGLEVAQRASGRCHVVFVTAYDKYAVAAFEQGAVDYVMKPFSPARLDATIMRLQGAAVGSARGPGRNSQVTGDDARQTQGLPALDHGGAGRFAAPHHRRRNPLLPRRPQVHVGRHRRFGGADPAAAQVPGRGSRPADVLADPPLGAGQRQRDRRREPRFSRPPAGAPQGPQGNPPGRRELRASVQADVDARPEVGSRRDAGHSPALAPSLDRHEKRDRDLGEEEDDQRRSELLV